MIKIICFINDEYVERTFDIDSEEIFEFIRENNLHKHGYYMIKLV